LIPRALNTTKICIKGSAANSFVAYLEPLLTCLVAANVLSQAMGDKNTPVQTRPYNVFGGTLSLNQSH